MPNAKKYPHDFLKLSAELTGFNEADLEATGMVKVYFKTVVDRTEPSVIDLFFDAVAEILDIADATDRENAIRSRLIPVSAYKGLAQRIILLWYEGLWTTKNSEEYVSAQSYIQGLMWPAARTHPSGAKQPGFGSWAEPPL